MRHAGTLLQVPAELQGTGPADAGGPAGFGRRLPGPQLLRHPEPRARGTMEPHGGGGEEELLYSRVTGAPMISGRATLVPSHPAIISACP